MITWDFFVAVFDGEARWVKPGVEMRSARTGLIRVSVRHEWTAIRQDMAPGHQFIITWRGPRWDNAGYSVEAEGRSNFFVTQEFFECVKTNSVFEQDIGHGHVVNIGIDEPNEALGDNPKEAAAFKVSVIDQFGDIRPIKRAGMPQWFGPEPVRARDVNMPRTPKGMAALIKDLLSRQRDEDA